MFFEGSEKKIEVVVSSANPSLRRLGDAFWAQVVASANAEILSKLSNTSCDAYILSESSLFVWDHKFLMLTCGTTTLADAVLLFVDKLGEESIVSASYQRKSESLSHLQASSFECDLSRLREKIAGQAYRVGHLDTHHHYIFCADRGEQVCPPQSSCELLMYHIKGDVAEYLRSDNQTSNGIRDMLRLDTLFPDFTFDDHLFEPFGYSINGLCKDRYMTIHITPQEKGSYVSVETNLHFKSGSFNIFSEMLNMLNPRSWDVIGFNTKLTTDGFPACIAVASCSLTLAPGETVHFNQFHQQSNEVLIPESL
ncbi:adenosylmethionine decarboxylase [uncultured Shewanella sp.]|uniref:adenosylmethionine decarboxylase n=1 Tax=uncultured Shewanella sp. TaxID=173975 RepID=UPI002632E112|nr:adenosylmethionine decarboxylase [uncultured Shewanella sp.]